MNILHILSQTILTGAEAYAVDACNEFQQRGHRTWICSDTIHLSTKATVLLKPVHDQKKWAETLTSLRELVFREQIQLIHTHSRASAKLARKICHEFPEIVHVHTFHGLQKSSFSKRWINSFGDGNIFVCENIQRSLELSGIRYSSHFKTIRNGIKSSERTSQAPSALQTRKIAVVSRLSNLKGERTMEVLRGLMRCQNVDGAEIHLIAGDFESLRQEDQTAIQTWQKQSLPRFFFHGFVNDLSQHLLNYDLVIAGGRIAAEALMNEKSVLAFGESEFVGWIDQFNLPTALASNFGDIVHNALRSPWPQTQLDELIQLGLLKWKQQTSSSNDQQKQVASFIQNEFGFLQNVNRIMQFYHETLGRRLSKSMIPVLMYHKIVHEKYETPHKIYVLARDFEEHLRFFKQQGFTTIHFKDYQRYRNGDLPSSSFPQKPLIITFDDGYLNNQEIALPLLEKYGMKATVFLLANSKLATNSWDSSTNEKEFPLMSPKQRFEFSRHPLIEIGSHGFSHAPLDSMTNVEDRKRELSESKHLLERELDLPITTYAYTYGRRSPDASELAKQAGYDFAVNTDTGGLHLEDDPWSIFRISMFPHETKTSLWKKTRFWYRRYYFWKRKK